MSAPDPVHLIEATYRQLDAPDDAWLPQVREAAQLALPDAHWVSLSHVKIERGRLTTLGLAADEVRQVTHEQWHAAATPELIEAIYLRGPYSRLAPLIVGTPFEPALRSTGARELVGAVGLDPSGQGLVLSYGAPTRAIPHGRRWMMERVAAHLASAARLRLGSTPTDAVLDGTGRVLDAEHDARAPEARDALRDAAKRIDRARSTRTRAGDRLALWNALVEGRWSLVERFETDGRRLFVARRNPPKARPAAALAPSERTVIALVAMGRPLKVIAYELGHGEPWVSRTLRSALAKLGLRSRAELLSLHGAIATDVELEPENRSAAGRG